MNRKIISAMAASAGLGMLLGVGFVAVSGETVQQSPSAERLETPLDVANRLDTIIQQRFLAIDKRFGMSRIMKLSGHDGVRFFPETDEEKRAMEEVRFTGRAYVIGFRHTIRPM